MIGCVGGDDPSEPGGGSGIGPTGGTVRADDGNVVLEFPAGAVARFDEELEYLGATVRRGSGMCEAEVVLTVDAYGNAHATDWTNGMILKFRPPPE